MNRSHSKALGLNSPRVLHLGNDHVSDAFAIGFHSENLVFVAGGDVELDLGAAAIRVVGVSG